MTHQTQIQEPEELTEYTAVQDPKSEIPNPKSDMEIVVLENSETGLVTIDTSAYAGRPINRNLSAGQASSSTSATPSWASTPTPRKSASATCPQDRHRRPSCPARSAGVITGAHPLPGTNGIHAWRDKKGYLCIQFGIGFWRQQGSLAGGILWISRPRPMTDEERAEHLSKTGLIAEVQHAATATPSPPHLPPSNATSSPSSEKRPKTTSPSSSRTPNRR